jgi:hypothetical protein
MLQRQPPAGGGRARDAAIFERHLDLSRLHGRSRGLVPCIFHPHRGRTPSLSVDLDKAVFHCFACGEQGGLLRFRELVGEGPPSRPHRGRSISAYEEAVRALLRRERALASRCAEWWPYMLANDYLRDCWKAVREARRWAQLLGPDNARTWRVLELAARVETEARVIESQLDDILADGRIA